MPRHGLGTAVPPSLPCEHSLSIHRTLTSFRLLAYTHAVDRLLTVWSCPRLFPQASRILLAAASSLIFRDVLISSFPETDFPCRRYPELRWRLQWPIPLSRYVIQCALPSSEGVQPTEFDHRPIHSRVTRSSMVCVRTPCGNHPLHCSSSLLFFLFRIAARSNHSGIGNSAQPPSRYDYPSFYISIGL